MRRPRRARARAGELRVLSLVPDLTATGGDRWGYELMRLWALMGIEAGVFHVLGRAERAQVLPPPGVEVLGGSDRAKFRDELPATFVRLCRALRRYDVLVIRTVTLDAVIGYVAARVMRRPVVAYSQGIIDESLDLYQSPGRRRLLRFVLRRVDFYLCVTPESGRAAVRIGVSPDRIAEVRTSLDVDHVRALAREPVAPEIAASTPLSGPRARRAVINVGSVEYRKGQDLLVRAIAALRAQGHDVPAVLVGPDHGTAAEIRALAARWGVADLVCLAGSCENPMPLIARAGAMVHTARSEAVGLVMLEALALGVPVVANDSPSNGPRLVLDDGRLGRLVDAEDPEALAAAIRDALEDGGRDAAGVAAEAYLRAEFSPERAAATAIRILRSIAAGEHPSALDPAPIAARA
jgi:glycosyltransferase involved in cell wall biosynthesis